MSRYLLKEDLTFRCDTEPEAQGIVSNIKRQKEIIKSEIKKIEKKDDTYFKVKVTTRINDEKNPCEALPL